MRVNGRPYRTIWVADDAWAVCIIDQTALPHDFVVRRLERVEDVARAIVEMQVRGAPLIGAAAAYGVCLAVHTDGGDASLGRAIDLLGRTRPTAVNLRWALERMGRRLWALPPARRAEAAYAEAQAICDEDVVVCRAIGVHGVELIRAVWEGNGRSRPVSVLTHCNAGWLATVDWGTALAPVYTAMEQEVPVHVWVDETRPRNQGASLTAWELGQHGVPHTVIADNAGGHLMQHGEIDLCLVGTDRTTARGDVANKIGTYLKALAAFDNRVPFYVALPASSYDAQLGDGVRDIPIEQRDASEVTHVRGLAPSGDRVTVRVVPEGARAANPGFDVTPARLVSAYVTEHGIARDAAALRLMLHEVSSP